MDNGKELDIAWKAINQPTSSFSIL